MDDFHGPPDPLQKGWILTLAVIAIGVLFGLSQAAIAVYADLDPQRDAAILHLLGAALVTVLVILVVSAALWITRRAHRRAVSAWLKRHVPDEVTKHFADRFGQNIVDMCYNPLSVSYFLLSVEQLVAEYFRLAAEAGGESLLAFEKNLIDDTNPNLRSWRKHIGDAETVFRSLEAVLRNDPWRRMVDLIPPWPVVSGQPLVFRQLPAEARRIAHEFRLQVYDSLNRDPQDNNEARDCIHNAGIGAGKIVTMLNSFIDLAIDLESKAKECVRDSRCRGLLNLKHCRPPGVTKDDVLATVSG